MAPKTSTSKKLTTNPSEAASGLPSVRDLPDGSVSIAVHAKPNAKQSAVLSVWEEAVEVQIGAAAQDGAANAQLLHFLAQVLQVKKTMLSLDRGSRSREKLVIVTAGVSAGHVLQRLRQACQQSSSLSR